LALLRGASTMSQPSAVKVPQNSFTLLMTSQ
jgi:hypothetical protein